MHTVCTLVKGIVPFVFVCCVLLVSPAVGGEPPMYTITEIGPLPGDDEAQALGINEAGDVVGFSGTSLVFPDCCLTTGNAFLYRDGELIDLGRLNGLKTRAEAINNLGQVVGWADVGFPRAFLWQDGEIQDIGTLGGGFSKASAINDAGLTTVRADEITNIGIITEEIRKHIQAASIIIADLTNQNANVFYELGMAHADSKTVIMITQRDTDVPFDIRHIKYFTYLGIHKIDTCQIGLHHFFPLLLIN